MRTEYATFIGEDGSMGLRHGKIYKVKVFYKEPYIYVKWGFFRKCPYESINSLYKNWVALW